MREINTKNNQNYKPYKTVSITKMLRCYDPNMNIPKPHTYLPVLVILAAALVFTAAAPGRVVQASDAFGPFPLAARTAKDGGRFAESQQDESWNARQDLSEFLFPQGVPVFTKHQLWDLPAHLRSTQPGVNGYSIPGNDYKGGIPGSHRLVDTTAHYLGASDQNNHQFSMAQAAFFPRPGMNIVLAQDLRFHIYLPLIQRPANDPVYFKTLPPGSKLPTDAECAAMIKPRPENKRPNRTYNATPGNQKLAANFFDPYSNDPRANSVIAARVSGSFTGTTDEILQWVACKWGVDEDMVRAQAAIESWWRQDTKGDWTTDASRCAPGHGLGVDGQPGQCPESFGILQNRYPYEKSAWPGIDTSTSFNADTAYGIWRACFEGYEWWLNDVERGWDYAAGDAWGCMGRWFSGRWHTAAAEYYIGRVKEYYNTRIWEQSYFQEP